jgi:hypothetical protein
LAQNGPQRKIIAANAFQKTKLKFNYFNQEVRKGKIQPQRKSSIKV